MAQYTEEQFIQAFVKIKEKNPGISSQDFYNYLLSEGNSVDLGQVQEIGSTLSALPKEDVIGISHSSGLSDFDILNFSEEVLASSQSSLSDITNILPNLALALATLFLGWLLGSFLRWLFIVSGKRLHLDRFWESIGFDRLLKQGGVNTPPSEVLGTFLKGVIITLFLRGAAIILGFEEIEIFLQSVINMVPSILIALLVLLFAIKSANTASFFVENVVQVKDEQTKKILAGTAKNILIAFGIMIALFQLNIAQNFIEILFTAFVAMLALAGGLAFGLGGKEFIHDMLNEIRKEKD